MKKLILSVFVAVVGFQAQAQAQAIGPAGCGLGNIVFGGKDSQVFAATTNGTFGSQTFGISSGTSNCVDSARSKRAGIENFVEANRLALANDAARGEGETITNLSKLLGCQNEALVGAQLKANYSTVFSNENWSANEASENIRNVLKGNAKVASSCQLLG